MKKILSIIVIGLLFAGSTQAKFNPPKPTNEKLNPCFDQKGVCLHCKGTGKVKNKKYSKKSWTEKKYIKCSACDGKGKKAEEKNELKKPPKDEVEITCKKCKKNFVFKLKKGTITKRKRIFFLAKCPHCKKLREYKMDNPFM